MNWPRGNMHVDIENLVQFLFRKPSLRRAWACAALGFGVVATVTLVRLLRICLGFLFRDALNSSIKLPFVLSGLGFLALFIGLVIKWKRQGWPAMEEHLLKHLFESLIPVAAAWIAYFLFNLVYAIPHRIRGEASTVQPPKQLFIIPSPNECLLDPASCRPKTAFTLRRTPPPTPDPRLQLPEQALKMADTLSNLEVQMESDLKDLSVRRDRDIEAIRPNGSQQDRATHDAQIREAWAPDEKAIRDKTAQTFQKCCQKEALDLREKLMLQVPGVSSYETERSYSAIPLPGFPDLAGRSLMDYTNMVNDLRKLANAYEQKIKANSYSTGDPDVP